MRSLTTRMSWDFGTTQQLSRK